MRSVGVAEKLLISLGVTAPEEIDVEAIAYTQGAIVRDGALQSCEARIIGVNDSAIITVQTGADPRRRRFSIAHELGHWQHHRGKSSVCRSNEIGSHSQSTPLAERQADRFAAELLMPRYLFNELARAEGRPTFDAIAKLAKAFATSFTSTAIRYVELTSWPCMLVCHSSGGRKWFVRNAGVSDRWFPQDQLSPDSDAMNVLYGSGSRTRQHRLTASAWFDRREADRFFVVEQSIKIFNGEVITLLVLSDEMAE